MVVRAALFTSKTLDALVARLLAYQTAVARCVEALRSEATEALGRVADGTYGYCVGCGVNIPLQRLRALPATASCITCSRTPSHRVARNLVDRGHLRSWRIRGRSPDGFGVPAAGGER